jgi:predicted RNA-binding protein with PUA-like domain
MAAAKKKSSTSQFDNQGNGYFVGPKKKPTTPTGYVVNVGTGRKVSVGSDLDAALAKKYSSTKRVDMQSGKKAFISSFQDVVSEGQIKMPNGKVVAGTSSQAQAAARRIATQRWEGSKDYYASNKIPTNKRGPKIDPYKAFKK